MHLNSKAWVLLHLSPASTQEILILPT